MSHPQAQLGRSGCTLSTVSGNSESQPRPEPILIHWVDTTGTTRDPVSRDMLLGWIDGGHLPVDTPAWWDGLDSWTTAVELRATEDVEQSGSHGDSAPAPNDSAQGDATSTHADETATAPGSDGPPDGSAAYVPTASTFAAPEATAPTSDLPAPLSEPIEAPHTPEVPAPAGMDEPDDAAPVAMAAPAESAMPDLSTQAEPPNPTDPAGLPAPQPQAAAGADLTDAFEDQDLDDTFMELVSRSSDIYKESERATSMDEVFLGGVIAAFGDSGYVLIDIFTGGSLRSTGSASAAAQTATPLHRHELRFEDPATGARVALVLDHLTPDVGSAKVLGQRARIELGYGKKVPNFGQVGRALRQEMASTFVVSPEPGRVTFDADLSSGFVYCQVDLLWELDRYVDDHMDVDADLLRKHLAASVHTLRKFLQLRFGD